MDRIWNVFLFCFFRVRVGLGLATLFIWAKASHLTFGNFFSISWFITGCLLIISPLLLLRHGWNLPPNTQPRQWRLSKYEGWFYLGLDYLLPSAGIPVSKKLAYIYHLVYVLAMLSLATSAITSLVSVFQYGAKQAEQGLQQPPYTYPYYAFKSLYFDEEVSSQAVVVSDPISIPEANLMLVEVSSSEKSRYLVNGWVLARVGDYAIGDSIKVSKMNYRDDSNNIEETSSVWLVVEQ